jgi:hypothetical protein
MALLKVGSADLPTPSDYSIGVLDITQAERNAKGTMLIERIAQKKKISISYKYCDGATLSQILTAINPIYFNLTYLDPITNTYKTGSFYVGDRNMGMIDFQDSVPRYKDLSFEFIER